MKKVGIIGSGAVGKVLATGLMKYGYSVMIGTRESSKLNDWVQKNPNGKVGSFAETSAFGEIIVLAVKGIVATDALNLCGLDNLKNKTIIDATNPIGNSAPVNGVLQYFTDSKQSLMENCKSKLKRRIL